MGNNPQCQKVNSCLSCCCTHPEKQNLDVQIVNDTIKNEFRCEVPLHLRSTESPFSSVRLTSEVILNQLKSKNIEDWHNTLSDEELKESDNEQEISEIYFLEDDDNDNDNENQNQDQNGNKIEQPIIQIKKILNTSEKNSFEDVQTQQSTYFPAHESKIVDPPVNASPLHKKQSKAKKNIQNMISALTTNIQNKNKIRKMNSFRGNEKSSFVKQPETSSVKDRNSKLNISPNRKRINQQNFRRKKLVRRNNQITITKSFNDPSPVLLKTRLFRYKPGISVESILRWCVLSENTFAYYKSPTDSNPLFWVPLKYVSQIKKIKMEISEKKNKKEELFLKKFQGAVFEFFLTEELSYERLGFHHKRKTPQLSRQNSRIQNYNVKKMMINDFQTQKCRDSASFVNKISPTMSLRGSTSRRQSLLMLKNDRTLQRQSSFIQPQSNNKGLNQSFASMMIDDNPIELYTARGHLMRDPISSRRSSINSQHLEETNDVGKDKRNSLFFTSIANGFMQIGETKFKPDGNEDENSNKKKAVHETWTKRELDWYFAESRFLFAAESIEDAHQWIKHFEERINYYLEKGSISSSSENQSFSLI